MAAVQFFMILIQTNVFLALLVFIASSYSTVVQHQFLLKLGPASSRPLPVSDCLFPSLSSSLSVSSSLSHSSSLSLCLFLSLSLPL